MEVFLIVILVAAIIEAVWETLKKLLAPLVRWLDDRGFPADQLGALLVALLICLGLGSRVDLFVMLGIPLEVAYLGIILTAVLLSRGSNFIHDLLGTLNGIRESNKLIDFEAGSDDMSVQIIQDLIPAGRRNRPGHKLTPKYITVHDTANPDAGANSKAHAGYLKGAAAAAIPASWHFTVDDKEIYQHLPLDENGWHAGDGTNGPGNRQSIGIEICENKDGSRVQAEKNAAWLTAKLLRDHGLEIAAVKQHFNWSGKDCPHILRARPGGWAGFLSAVEAYLKTAVSPVPSADRFMVVSFDDFNASDYLLAYPTLKSLGVRGTSYAHTGPITAEGWSRAREMVADGWDIQCHTVTHPDLRELSDLKIHYELQEVNRVFAANGLPVPQHHAYPSGLYDDRVKSIIKQYRKTARSTRADTYDGINRDTLSWYDLHPIGSDVQNDDEYAYWCDRINQAYSNNRIVITIHHGVCAADEPNPTRIMTRENYLRRMVEYAQQKGFRIVTISQLYRLLTGESEPEKPVPADPKPVIPTGPLPAITRRIGIEVNGQMATQEAGYLINNATYVRAAYVVGLTGGEVTGHGDHIKIVTRK